MNTKKILAGVFTCLILMAASCTTDTAEGDLYEDGVNKKQLINGDKNSVDKTKLINGDMQSVDKTQLKNGDKKG